MRKSSPITELILTFPRDFADAAILDAISRSRSGKRIGTKPVPDIFMCNWLIDTRQHTEDGEPIIVECGAFAWATDRGDTCEAGHEHVTAEVRWREGWDYVTEDEAAGYAKDTGRTPVLMDGKVWLG